MPQFSMKRRLLSTAQIAVGTAGYSWFIPHPADVPFPFGPRGWRVALVFQWGLYWSRDTGPIQSTVVGRCTRFGWGIFGTRLRSASHA